MNADAEGGERTSKHATTTTTATKKKEKENSLREQTSCAEEQNVAFMEERRCWGKKKNRKHIVRDKTVGVKTGRQYFCSKTQQINYSLILNNTTSLKIDKNPIWFVWEVLKLTTMSVDTELDDYLEKAMNKALSITSRLKLIFGFPHSFPEAQGFLLWLWLTHRGGVVTLTAQLQGVLCSRPILSSSSVIKVFNVAEFASVCCHLVHTRKLRWIV